MKLYSKRLVSVLIIFVLMFSLCTATIFATGTYGTVNGNVVNTDEAVGNIGVSNIQLDVYALVSVYTDSNQTDFDKVFAFSVYTDAEGAYTFTKPSANCIVEINENSVADSCGVLTGIDIIGADDTTSELSISPLATYEVDLADNSLQFYNAEDKKLTVKENLDSSALGNVQLRATEESVSLLSDTDLAPVGAPVYNDPVTYTEGIFTYHYERGALTDRELSIFVSQFNHTKTSLCNTYGFREPKFATGLSTYNVYFQTNGMINAGTTVIGETGTHISINISSIYNLAPDDDNYATIYAQCIKAIRGAISHETMHAIQIAYDNFSGNDYKAFCNNVAELSKLAFANGAHSPWVRSFQQSPELSLLNNGDDTVYPTREYCALFPVYLYENYSQFNVIRKIYEEYSEVKDIYIALDNVLSEQYNSSLVEAYLSFRVWAYDVKTNSEIKENFDFVLEDNANSPKKTAITENAVTYTTPMLSTMYFEFEAETEDFYTFCFALQGETKTSEVNLTGIYTSPDGDVNIITYPFTSRLKMPNVDMEEGSTICFLMSNINTTETDIQFYTCM